MIDPRLKQRIRNLIESDVEIDTQTRKKLAKEFDCRTVDVANVIYRIKNPFYWRKHRTRRQVVAQNSRARRLGVKGQLREDDWVALCEKHNGICLRCKGKKPLCIDHIMPISRGGTNTIDNVQPLCHECNREKQDKYIDYR